MDKIQLINVENQASSGVLSTVELNKIVDALQYQSNDFNDSPWVEHGYCDPIRIEHLAGAPAVGTWNIIFIDDTSVEGALGFHEDINGGKIPVSYVAIKETREDNTSLSEVASHEMVEMAVDPFVTGNDDIRTVTHDNKQWIVEIADPLQGCSYKAHNGQELANFVWPKWFGLTQTRKALGQRGGYISAPFSLAPEGYISVKSSGQEWQQIFGEKRTSLPKWASRLPRIEGK